MGKLKKDLKAEYFYKFKGYKEEIQQIKRQEAHLEGVIATGQAGTSYKRIILADIILNIVSYDLLINALSQTLLGVKNEAYLNDARKGCYKALINLEKVVSNQVEAPFSSYADLLTEIAQVDNETRFFLLRKLGYSIDGVVEGFGANSKWKWSFVEIEARYAAVVKNMINLKTYHSGLDPRKKEYGVLQAHMNLALEFLQKAADGYRQKYELSTRRQDDFRIAINYLSAIHRLHILLGNSAESDLMKKKIEVWRAKLEADIRVREDGAGPETKKN